MVFLCETKCDMNNLKMVQLRRGFLNCWGVDACGKSRGLNLLWNDEVSMRIMSLSRHHIDAKIGGIGGQNH